MKLHKANVDDLNRGGANTIAALLGIRFVVAEEDRLEATMPVDHRTHQPYGLLHGGASVTLAETLGSVASALCVDRARYRCVGIEVNANHVRSVSSGSVRGVVRPIHVGRSTHVWEIRITDESNGKLVCVSRLTVAVVERKAGDEAPKRGP